MSAAHQSAAELREGEAVGDSQVHDTVHYREEDAVGLARAWAEQIEKGPG